MRARKYIETLTIKISKSQRAAIEDRAEALEISIGEAAREFLDTGIRAIGS